MKVTCLSLLYGSGLQTASRQMGSTVEEAATFKRKFLSAFPEVEAFVKETVASCRRSGEIRTLTGEPLFSNDSSVFALEPLKVSLQEARRSLSGRFRRVVFESSTNSLEVSKASAALGERLAVNSKIQGSAADILKIAMLRVQRFIGETCVAACPALWH